MSNSKYPPYYKPVFVKYKIKWTNIIKTQKMWLAFNGNGDYIWVNANNNTPVLPDELIELINWWECSTNGESPDSTKNY